MTYLFKKVIQVKVGRPDLCGVLRVHRAPLTVSQGVDVAEARIMPRDVGAGIVSSYWIFGLGVK